MTDDRPTRRIASYMLRQVVDFLGFAVNHYGLSIEEVAIVCLVATESTRPIVEHPSLSNTYGNEAEVLPLAERVPVTLKFIYASLGINRETARRKLERLAERGYIIKTPKGYIVPEQTGTTDFSLELRNYLLQRFEMISAESIRLRCDR